VTDHKKSVMAALLRHHAKDAKELDKLNNPSKRKKNQKPEKELQSNLISYMKGLGWQVEVYNSQATMTSYGVWKNQTMKAGTPDIMGLLPNGVAIACEVKAPGKLKTFNNPKNQRQIDFIKNCIKMNGFAVVVDSVERLKEIFDIWTTLQDPDAKKEYLTRMLP